MRLRHWATKLDGCQVIGYAPPDHNIVHLALTHETVTIITKRKDGGAHDGEKA